MIVSRSFENGMYMRLATPADHSKPAHTLLFVHGLGESGLCFENLLNAPEFSNCCLMVPDLPGYGRSPWLDEGPQGLAQQADYLAQWMKDRNEPPVVVVGHSMGAVVGLLMAERHPETVKAVVDVDGNKSLGDCVFSGQAAKYELDDFCQGGFDTLREQIHQEGIQDLAQRGYYVSLRLADPQAYHLNSRELLELSQKEDMAQRLAKLSMPAVYMAGNPGGACEASRDLLKNAGARFIDISPSGHWPFIDQKADFLQAVAQWLGELPAD